MVSLWKGKSCNFGTCDVIESGKPKGHIGNLIIGKGLYGGGKFSGGHRIGAKRYLSHSDNDVTQAKFALRLCLELVTLLFENVFWNDVFSEKMTLHIIFFCIKKHRPLTTWLGPGLHL